MKIADIQQMIRRVLGTGYDDWTNEVAVKCYFFPFAEALLSDDEWQGVILADGINMRPDKVQWTIDTFAERLSQLVKDMSLEGEHHISIIVYGLTADDEHVDFIVHVSTPECEHVVGYEGKVLPIMITGGSHYQIHAGSVCGSRQRGRRRSAEEAREMNDQIALASSWVNKYDSQLPPLTQVTADDVRQGRFIPAPGATFTKNDAIKYLDSLAVTVLPLNDQFAEKRDLIQGMLVAVFSDQAKINFECEDPFGDPMVEVDGIYLSLSDEGDPPLWCVGAIVHDPGVRYHKDGSGTPPSDDYVSISEHGRDFDGALRAFIAEIVNQRIKSYEEYLGEQQLAELDEERNE